jgi:hypothetical protein
VKERTVVQDEYTQGDRVVWNTPQGKTRGTVKEILTSETEVGGQKVNASEDDHATSSRARRAAKRPPTNPTP